MIELKKEINELLKENGYSEKNTMRLSGKSKLLKKKPVGAASSRELKRSRLEAAPTKSNTLVLSR